MRPALYLALLGLALTLGFVFSACGDECSRVGDCPTGEVCFSGECTPGQASYLPCSSNADCAGDSSVLICLAGRCTFNPNGVGTITADSGFTDAGAVDTGSSDGGRVDAAPTDTGATDTGPADTGATDTGLMDAGLTDTGPTDTGANDAGPRDAMDAAS